MSDTTETIMISYLPNCCKILQPAVIPTRVIVSSPFPGFTVFTCQRTISQAPLWMRCEDCCRTQPPVSLWLAMKRAPPGMGWVYSNTCACEKSVCEYRKERKAETSFFLSCFRASDRLQKDCCGFAVMCCIRACCIGNLWLSISVHRFPLSQWKT